MYTLLNNASVTTALTPVLSVAILNYYAQTGSGTQTAAITADAGTHSMRRHGRTFRCFLTARVDGRVNGVNARPRSSLRPGVVDVR